MIYLYIHVLSYPLVESLIFFWRYTQWGFKLSTLASQSRVMSLRYAKVLQFGERKPYNLSYGGKPHCSGINSSNESRI